MSLYEGAVKKPIMTSLCFLAVVIFGLFSLSKLPVDLYPDIDTNTKMVMTTIKEPVLLILRTMLHVLLRMFLIQLVT
jgi:Cu/Ag efflux pump CusA